MYGPTFPEITTSIPGRTRRPRRRAVVAALLAGAAVLCACGGSNDDEAPRPPASAQAESAKAAVDPNTPHRAIPQPLPPGASPNLPSAEQDSINEAKFYNHRLQSMESYDSCMRKAASADPPVRSVLQAACARSHPQH
jgi:hypothetical protein